MSTRSPKRRRESSKDCTRPVVGLVSVLADGRFGGPSRANPSLAIAPLATEARHGRAFVVIFVKVALSPNLPREVEIWRRIGPPLHFRCKNALRSEAKTDSTYPLSL
jgi:hypothetical protein